MNSDRSSGQATHPAMSRAISATREGRYKDALMHLKRIVADRPDDPIAIGMLAGVYADLGMKDDARQHFDQILATDPENPLARYQRGVLDFEAGELDSALQFWRPLLDTEQDFMGHFYSALALMQLGRLSDVRGLLETARDRMPGDHPLQQQLEKLFEVLGDA